MTELIGKTMAVKTVLDAVRKKTIMLVEFFQSFLSLSTTRARTLRMVPKTAMTLERTLPSRKWVSGIIPSLIHN